MRQQCPYEHLGDLEECDESRKVLCKLVHPSSHQEVVEVHDAVDSVVHAGKPDASGDCVVVGMPAVEQDWGGGNCSADVRGFRGLSFRVKVVRLCNKFECFCCTVGPPETWWYQCRKITGFWRMTRKTVSNSSGILERQNRPIQSLRVGRPAEARLNVSPSPIP